MVCPTQISETRTVFGMSFAAYQSANGISKSTLDRMHPTPAHCKAWMDNPIEERTEALDFGKLFHAAILEQRFDYVVKPEGHDGRTKAGKEWNAENEGRLTLGRKEDATLKTMLAKAKAHPFVGPVLKVSQFEISVFSEDRSTGLIRKSRIDAIPAAKYCPDSRPIIDIKTACSAEKHSFSSEIRNRRYHVQGAYYLDNWNDTNPTDLRDTFVFVVFEKEPPFEIAVYELDPDTIAQGRKEYRRDLTMFAHCMKNDSWPGYNKHAELIRLPEWAIEKEAA